MLRAQCTRMGIYIFLFLLVYIFIVYVEDCALGGDTMRAWQHA